jgi:diaminopimelate epimerase
MAKIPFYKMSGAGNDFIVIDNRRDIVQQKDLSRFAVQVCRRKMSVGADGLFLLENSDRADFKWQFFNSDGSVAEMCGNGARCAARFAFLTGMTGDRMTFETLAGIIGAHVRGDQVKVKMTDPQRMALDQALTLSSGRVAYSSVNTGVPHAVLEVADVETVNVKATGREIRYHAQFAPAGTNANFVAPLSGGLYAIRTYERGVEDETLACGTGNAAAALTLAARHGLASPVTLRTRSNSLLKVYFVREGDRWREVYLEGDARVVYVAEMDESAWVY